MSSRRILVVEDEPTQVFTAGSCAVAPGQQDDRPLEVFGYMQAGFASLEGTTVIPAPNTFLLRQLNVRAARVTDCVKILHQINQ